jgi:hypothetical protein
MLGIGEIQMMGVNVVGLENAGKAERRTGIICTTFPIPVPGVY